MDPNNKADGFPVVKIETGKPGFLMKTYLNQAKIDGGSCEAMAALSPVIGAKLVGLDATKMHGVDYVQRSKAWYDPRLGLYRNRPGDSSPIVHADIYGYWPAILGMMLAAQYPGDAEFQAQLKTSIAAFKTIAQGMGAPEQPNFFAYGWDFGKQAPGGRLEPMNRLGHAPSVAWPLMIDASLNGDLRSGRDATAIMKWYEHHPGRYEISHMMGPLTAARLNAMSGGEELDLGKSLNAWFGDGDAATHPWKITAGINFNGRTVDGLDAARSGNSDADFYAFTMGSLQGPAWLVPVARYDQRYARAIARYALHAANSARYLQGEGLDAEHQDHAAWKAKWDKDNLLFYEGLRSKNFGETPGLQPYATGDPVVNGWGTGRPAIKDKTQYLLQREQWFGKRSDNLALYMGNHVGFLGGIESGTNVSGILRWDCLATDWFHPPAYPTSLFYNPHSETEKVTVRLAKPASLYDTVSGRFLATNVKSRFQLQLAPDQSAVLVEIEPSAQLERKNGKLLADGIVVDYRVQRN
ncbi:hypothetical protein EON80_07695 [bacterium]|nr:MAG: hypothetical protein EON80_07695 [bacterium]